MPHSVRKKKDAILERRRIIFDQGCCLALKLASNVIIAARPIGLDAAAVCTAKQNNANKNNPGRAAVWILHRLLRYRQSPFDLTREQQYYISMLLASWP